MRKKIILNFIIITTLSFLCITNLVKITPDLFSEENKTETEIRSNISEINNYIEQKIKEIKNLKISKQRISFILHISVLLIIILLLYYRYYLKVKMNKQLQKEMQERCIAEKELQKIKKELEERIKKRTTEFVSTSHDLKLVEKNYTNLIQKIHEGLVIVDKEERFTYANPSALEIFDCSEDELIGKNVRDFMDLEKFNKVTKQTELRKKGESSKYETIILREDGQKRIVKVSASPITEDNEYLGAIAIFVDITEQRKNEKIQSVLYNILNAVNTTEDLDELYKIIHKYLGLIIDTTNFCIALYDEKTNIITAPYYVDELMKSTPEPQQLMSGITAHVIRSRKSLYLTVEKRNELITQKIIPQSDWKSKIWLGVPLKIENRVVGVIVVQSYNNPDQFTENDLWILEFVSEQIAIAITRKRAERALKSSEEFNRAIIDYSPLGISARDRYGRLIIANKAWMKIWVKTKKDLLKDYAVRKKLEFNERDSYLGEHILKVKRVYEKGGSTFIPGIMVQSEKFEPEKIKWISQYFYAIKDENDEVDKVIIITEDITEHKKADEKIESSLREKELLLKEVHHRVKNNMQIISSMLKLQSGYISDEKALKLFKDSQHRVKSMALIHEKLYQSENFEQVDFKHYTQLLINYLVRSYNININRIKLRVEMEGVNFDITKAIPCGLIINELVSNSFKYAFPDDKEGEIGISIEYLKNEYIFIVQDNGIGFPPDIDFRNTDSLGMQLVIALTDQLHGKMELLRKEGTIFKINFPSNPKV